MSPQRTISIIILYLLLFAWPIFKPAQAEAETIVTAVVLKDLRPISFLDAKTDRPQGFAIDLMDAIAVKTGLQVNYLVVNNWQEAEEALKQGKADLCPVIAVNAARKAYLNFTTYTETSGVTINIRSKSAAYNSLADLEGHQIGTMRSSQAYQLIEKNPKLQVTLYDSYQVALLELLAGRTDAFIGPDNVIKNILKEAGISDQVTIIKPPLIEIKRAIAVRKEKPQLYKLIEKPTSDFVLSPAYQNLYSKWYGSPPSFWTTSKVLWLLGILGLITLSSLAVWRYQLVYGYNKRLSASERQFRGIFEQALQLLWLLELDGRTTEVNQTALKLVGAELRQVQDKLFWETSWFEHSQALQGQIKQAVEAAAQGTVVKFLVTLNSIEGTTHHLDFSIKPVRDEMGKICLLIPEGRDITERIIAEDALHEKAVQLEEEIGERQKAEEELRLINESLEERITLAVTELRKKDDLLIHHSRLAAMGELLTNIAHQWRQPLNNIAAYVQTMQYLHKTDKLSDVEMDNDITAVMDIIKQMSQTINDFRSFFRKDKACQEFVLKEVIDRSINLISSQLTAHSILVVVKGDEDMRAVGYPNEYAQGVVNILYNARDILLENSVANPLIEITISSEAGKSTVCIKDNGGGIPDSILPRIFEPYFTTKGPATSTGIGLYMARTLIERNMGGSLSVQNVEGGAEFKIKL